MKLFALSSQNLSFGGKLKILVMGPSRIQRFSMLLNTTPNVFVLLWTVTHILRCSGYLLDILVTKSKIYD